MKAKATRELVDELALRLLLRDMRALLCEIEWGGIANVDQCLKCGAHRNTGDDGHRDPRSDGHRAGCGWKSLMRRNDAMLRILDSKGG